MKASKLLMPTLREAPAEAEIASHVLMMRAGLISKLAAGVYSYLPLGLRVLQNTERIIREEMNKAGAHSTSFTDIFFTSSAGMPLTSHHVRNLWWNT